MLDGGPEVLRGVAMAANFGIKIAINWFCMNDSDHSIWLWRGCEWSADRMQILPIPCT